LFFYIFDVSAEHAIVFENRECNAIDKKTIWIFW
jgi:hypothetical protein